MDSESEIEGSADATIDHSSSKPTDESEGVDDIYEESSRDDHDEAILDTRGAESEQVVTTSDNPPDQTTDNKVVTDSINEVDKNRDDKSTNIDAQGEHGEAQQQGSVVDGATAPEDSEHLVEHGVAPTEPHGEAHGDDAPNNEDGDIEDSNGGADIQTSQPGRVSRRRQVLLQPDLLATKISHRMDFADLQKELQGIFRREFRTQRRCIGIHSETACRGCGHMLLDDETLGMLLQGSTASHFDRAAQRVATGGVGAGANSPNNPTSPSVAQPNATRSDFQPVISCPRCDLVLLPQLHVRYFELQPAEIAKVQAEGGDGDSSPRSPRHWSQDAILVEKWSMDVQYLSPLSLRIGLEEVIERTGERAARASDLHVRRPELYWSAVWFASRLGLPTCFESVDSAREGSETTMIDSRIECGGGGIDVDPSGAVADDGDGLAGREEGIPRGLFSCPVIVGWRRALVKHRIEKLLRDDADEEDETRGEREENAQLSAVFGGSCSRKALQGLKRAANFMDGSFSGMRKAMLEAHDALGLPRPAGGVAPQEGSKDSLDSARALLVTVLTLAHYFENEELLGAFGSHQGFTAMLQEVSARDIVDWLIICAIVLHQLIV